MVQAFVGNRTITVTDEERQECEVWTRVMGYYRPVSEFNIGKKSEHAERALFRENMVNGQL
ncbi:MAG: anaerobic ribonucleoside-triphosphate reductase [Candidatus Latescibacterota bacterium]